MRAIISMVISNKDCTEHKLMKGEIKWLNGEKIFNIQKGEGRK